MASLGSIFVDLLLNTGKFEGGVNRASQSISRGTNQWKRDLDKSKASFLNVSSIAARLVNIFAVGLSANKLIGDLKSVAHEMDEIGKASDRLGIATESLSGLAYAGKIANVDFGVLTKSIDKMDKALVSAIKSGDKTNLFKQLGLDAKEIINLKPEEALARIADGFKNIQNPAQKATAYLELFGKGGATMANLLKGGSAEIRQLVREAQELGVVFGRDAAQKAEDFNDSITRLTASYRALMISFVSSGGLEKVTQLIQFLAKNMNDLLGITQVVVGVYALKLTAAFVTNTVAANAQAIAMLRVQFAAYQLAGSSAAAAAGLTAMSVAGGVFARVLAIFGGPVGVAAIAVIAALTFHTSDADIANQKFKKAIDEVKFAQDQLNGTMGLSIEQLKKTRDEAYANAQAQLADAEATYERDRAYRALLQTSRTGVIAPVVNYDSTALDNIIRMRAEIEEQAKRLSEKPPGGSGVADSTVLENTKKLQDELGKLYEKNRTYITGLDDATFKYSDTIAELNKLVEAGKISQVDYNLALQRVQDEFVNAGEKASQWAIDVESMGKRAAENIQDAFADFLFDPFDKGLKGMLKGFVDVVRKMIAQAAAAKLGGLLFGGSGGGNIFSSLLGSFGFGGGIPFGGFGAATGIPASTLPATGLSLFAEGGFLQPGQWGIAGEKEAELIYGGRTGMSVIPQGKGGNTYNIDARGADQGAVRRLEQALITLAGNGVIEQRVHNAQVRGAL